MTIVAPDKGALKRRRPKSRQKNSSIVFLCSWGKIFSLVCSVGGLAVQKKKQFSCRRVSTLTLATALPTLAEKLADGSGAGVASGNVDRPVAVDPGNRLQRRARLDEGQDRGRVAPHGGVVKRPVAVHVFGVSVGPFLKETNHHLWYASGRFDEGV